MRDFGVTEFAWSKSIRKGRYRLVHYPREMFAEQYPAGFGELYDLDADPWEMRNLYFEPEYANVVAELAGDLLDWLIVTARPRTVLPAPRLEGEQAVTRYLNTTNPDGKIHPDRVREAGAHSRNYL